MKKNYFISLFLVMLFGVNFTSAQVTTPAIIGSPYIGDIYFVDTTTFTESTPITLTSSLGTVDGCNGMAVRPCNGDIYIIYKVSGISGRLLGILDPSSGIITHIGNTGDNVAGICFGSENQLYAVTGDGASVPETLYKVDLNTAAMTLFTALGNGGDGENIAFCEDNGKIYHWSGYNGTEIMESVDTLTGAVTPITLSGYVASEIFGSTYMGNGQFLINNIDFDYIVADTSGVLSNPVGTASGGVKGIVFPKAHISAATDTICDGDADTVLYSIVADSYQWLDNGIPIPGETNDSLIVTSSGDYQVQVTIDTCTYTSDTVHFHILNSPNVGINPSPSAYLCTVTDSVLLVGSMGGTSQWYLDGSAIPGANNDSIWATLPGNYNMTKTNMNGCTDSAAVGTIVDYPPTLAITPAGSVTFCTNDSTAIDATAGATSYQWYLDGVAITGATLATYYVSTPGTYTVAAMFDTCADSTSVGTTATEIDCGIGFTDEEGTMNLNVYPVPASNELYVTFNTGDKDNISIQLLSMDGKTIQQRNVSGQGVMVERIDLSRLPGGLYMIQIEADGLRTVRHFTKQ